MQEKSGVGKESGDGVKGRKTKERERRCKRKNTRLQVVGRFRNHACFPAILYSE